MRLGDHDRTITGEGILPEKTVNVSALHIHRDHDREKYNEDNDIALLELAEEVDLNIYTPACMAQVWTDTHLDVMYSIYRVHQKVSGKVFSTSGHLI